MDNRASRVVAFLNGCEVEIEDFSRKIVVEGFLRTALLSHLKVSFSVGTKEAKGMIDHWVTKEQ